MSILHPPLEPGGRRYLGYDEWLISRDEAQWIRDHGGIATVHGTTAPVHFIQTWDAGELVYVPGSGS